MSSLIHPAVPFFWVLNWMWIPYVTAKNVKRNITDLIMISVKYYVSNRRAQKRWQTDKDWQTTWYYKIKFWVILGFSNSQIDSLDLTQIPICECSHCLCEDYITVYNHPCIPWFHEGERGAGAFFRPSTVCPNLYKLTYITTMTACHVSSIISESKSKCSGG